VAWIRDNTIPIEKRAVFRTNLSGQSSSGNTGWRYPNLIGIKKNAKALSESGSPNRRFSGGGLQIATFAEPIFCANLYLLEIR
jgi:hypothetical protein